MHEDFVTMVFLAIILPTLYLTRLLKFNLYVQQRYGNSDRQNLATLKQKIWIHIFFRLLMLDSRLILIFRGPTYF